MHLEKPHNNLRLRTTREHAGLIGFGHFNDIERIFPVKAMLSHNFFRKDSIWNV